MNATGIHTLYVFITCYKCKTIFEHTGFLVTTSVVPHNKRLVYSISARLDASTMSDITEREGFEPS